MISTRLQFPSLRSEDVLTVKTTVPNPCGSHHCTCISIFFRDKTPKCLEKSDGSLSRIECYESGSNLTVIDSATSPHAINTSTNLLQRVHLDLSADAIVQECDNGDGSVVVQDFSCSVQQLAAHAIDDAITLVKAVMGIWNDNAHSGILQQYMGSIDSDSSDSCTGPEASAWIDGEFLKKTARFQH